MDIRTTRTPIVALTARATRDGREACMAAGMDDYVAKPVDPKVLYRVVESYPPAAHRAVPGPVSGPVDQGGSMHEADEPRDTAECTARVSDPASPESPIDWEVARSLTGGDAGLLDELVALFPGESAKHLEEIRAGMASGDAQRVARAAHTLKSSAGFFGARTLVACALEIEQFGKALNLPQAAARLPTLQSETSRLTDALAAGERRR